jgi:hypothetical protein
MAELFRVLELHEVLMSPRVDRQTQSFLLKQVVHAGLNEVRQVFPRNGPNIDLGRVWRQSLPSEAGVAPQ